MWQYHKEHSGNVQRTMTKVVQTTSKTKRDPYPKCIILCSGVKESTTQKQGTFTKSVTRFPGLIRQNLQPMTYDTENDR